MDNVKLFRVNALHVSELQAQPPTLEKSLQTLFEQNLVTLLGVRFLATEVSTGKRHGGRIDTLGLDENGLPVVIEYKRSMDANVVMQGLWYVDWLTEHKADFELRVLKTLGQEAAQQIDWSTSRLICVAGDFSKHDLPAVRQMHSDIDLVRYQRFSGDVIALDLIHTSAGVSGKHVPSENESIEQSPFDKAVAGMDSGLREVHEDLKAFLRNLGDDVIERPGKLYTAFRTIKNFACVVPQTKVIYVDTSINPQTVVLEPGFTRDVSNVGHWGTGNFQISIKTRGDLEKAKPFLRRAYDGA